MELRCHELFQRMRVASDVNPIEFRNTLAPPWEGVPSRIPTRVTRDTPLEAWHLRGRRHKDGTNMHTHMAYEDAPHIVAVQQGCRLPPLCAETQAAATNMYAIGTAEASGKSSAFFLLSADQRWLPALLPCDCW